MIDTLKLGNQGISKVYLGDQLLSALYLGTQLIYRSTNPAVQHKLSIIVTGLTDTYNLYVNGEILPSNDLYFNNDLILDGVTVNADNYDITPLKYDNVIMTQDRTLVYSGVTIITPVITFSTIPNIVDGDDDSILSVTSNNPNAPIVLTSLDTSIATVKKLGKTWYLHPVSNGTATIRASQVASAGYGAAANVDKTVTVTANNFDLASVSNTLLGWYDVANADNTLVAGKMSVLKNKVSSIAPDMIQSTDANRPSYFATGGVGNNPYINVNGKTLQAIVSPTTPLPFTFYLVLKQNDTTISPVNTGKKLLQFGADIYDGLSVIQKTGQLPTVQMASFAQYHDVPSVYQTDWNILSGVLGGTGNYFRINNDPKYVMFAVPTNQNQIQRFLLGGANTDVAFILIYNGVVSDASDLLIRKKIRAMKNLENTPTLISFGDSIVFGQLAGIPEHQGYVPLASAESGRINTNYGIPGATVIGQNISFEVVYVNAFQNNPQNAILYIAYGANDARVGNGHPPSNWKSTLKSKIQLLIDYGYDPSQIILGTAPYVSSVVTLPEFVQLISEISTELGTKFFNMYAYGLANGGDLLLENDGAGGQVHPDTAGMRIYANGLKTIINQI